MLIWYPETVLNFLIYSIIFFLDLANFLCSNHSVPKERQFNFLIFCSFSYLIVLARTFHTILNMCGKSGCPCLVPDHNYRECSWSFTIKYDFSGGCPVSG